MTGGSPDNHAESEDSYEMKASQNSANNKSFFDPPIENYRRIYRNAGGSHLSVKSSNLG